MVAVYDIINEAGSVGDFMLNAGDRIVHNGITAEWKGNQFQVTSMNATARDNYPDVRVNQPLPRKYRGGFVNALRASSGLQRIDFDGGGGVRGQINNTPVGVTPGNNDSRETEADSERRLRRRGAWAASKRAFQGTLGISLSLGLPLAAYSQLEQELKELHNLKYPIPPGEDGHDPQLWANPMSEEQYQIAAGRYFATWVGTFVVPALITILRKGRRAIMALLTPIRSMMAAAAAIRQGISIAAGPGFLGMAVFNALVLLLTEVGIYFAAQAIMRNENVRNALIKFVASYYGMQFAKAMDISYNVIGSAIVGAIDLATDDDDAVAAVKDAVDEFAATQGGAAPTVSDTEVGQGAAEVTPAAQGTGSGLDNVFD
jgi:hypothetical protein